MIVERLKQIIEDLLRAEEDVTKCETGNASAGRRVRKAAMQATKDLKELRALVLEHNK